MEKSNLFINYGFYVYRYIQSINKWSIAKK